MVTLQQAKDSDCDPLVVDKLVTAALDAMERASDPTFTTPSEIASASFTLLARTLQAMRRLQAPEDRFYNAKQVAAILSELLVDYGTVPN
jgi:hypothetical protein